MIDFPANGDENTAPPTEAPPRERSRRRESMGIRYGAMNWVGEFLVDPKLESPANAKIVIQTERGIELGERIGSQCGKCGKFVEPDTIDEYLKNSGPEFFRRRAGKVLRIATSADVLEHQRLNGDVMKDVKACRVVARDLQLKMKVVTAEHLLGGERIVFYFRSEDRIDFRQLVKTLAGQYQTRIEMRQVGARDEARLVADYEVCGRECCCKGFLKKLRPVTMKMAKLQKSTLDPSKVSGRCGRLRCCLRYENEGYEELAANLPRRGARAMTMAGIGTIIDRQVLTQLLLIRLDDGPEMAFPLEEIKIVPKDYVPPETTAKPTATPAAKSERPSRKPSQRPPKSAPPEKIEQSEPVRTNEPGQDEAAGDDSPTTEQEAPAKKRRRRRRRGAKPAGDATQSSTPATEGATPGEAPPRADQPASTNSGNGVSDTAGEQSDKPRRRRRRRRKPRPGSSNPESGSNPGGGPNPGSGPGANGGE